MCAVVVRSLTDGRTFDSRDSHAASLHSLLVFPNSLTCMACTSLDHILKQQKTTVHHNKRESVDRDDGITCFRRKRHSHTNTDTRTHILTSPEAERVMDKLADSCGFRAPHSSPCFTSRNMTRITFFLPTLPQTRPLCRLLVCPLSCPSLVAGGEDHRNPLM